MVFLGVDVLEIVIQLTYDNIPKDVKLGLDMVKSEKVLIFLCMLIES